MRLKDKLVLLAVGIAAPLSAQSDGPAIPPGTDPRYVSRDTVDYDEVGYAVVGTGAGVSAIHATLPPGSFVEVTALDSGRTILLRVVETGTMVSLIALSPDAAGQLGVSGGRIAVRVRRTNPPQYERTGLINGGRATERLPTPPALLNALRKRLGVTPVSAGPPVMVDYPKPVPVKAPLATKTTPKPKPLSKSALPVQPAAAGKLFIQVAALSNEARAKALAARIGGGVQAAGAVWRVRAGPYATEAAARAALGALKAKGYPDARITR